VALVKEDVRLRLHAVKQHLEKGVRAAEISQLFGISERTLRYWCRNYREEGVEGLRDDSRRPHHSPNRIHGNLVNRILQLRRKHPAWGALRIHAILRRRGVQVSWVTVHRVLKRHGFMVRPVKKPTPFKRFQRRHVDSLWQVDVYKFRIAGVRGHVYVHTILDDRSRYLVMARAYLRERAREATNNLW
jgi:transposase